MFNRKKITNLDDKHLLTAMLEHVYDTRMSEQRLFIGSHPYSLESIMKRNPKTLESN